MANSKAPRRTKETARAAAESNPAPAPRRRHRESDAVDGVDICANYKLEGATVGTMLVQAVSPWESAAVIQGGLQLAADELTIIHTALANGNVELNSEIYAHALAGIEGRLRVLREIASRFSDMTLAPTEVT